MPLVADGPLGGCYLPDYGGRSTINLMSSIIRSRGGTSPHPELEGLPAETLAAANNVLYIIVDGLGMAQLERHLEAGLGQAFFAKHPCTEISTVFPATTAAAVTTFDTGASPTEHGILSWFLHLPDLGVVSTVLRTHTRLGAPLFPEDFDLAAYYRVPSYIQSATCRLGLLSWGPIPTVPFAKAGTQWTESVSYDDLDGLVEAASAFGSHPERGLAYVYWPRYDGLCHEFGVLHEEVANHFDDIDAALGKLTENLAGTNSTICVLADHGLVDVARSRCVDLAEVPGLMDCLTVVASGDQRQLSCFVRPAKVDRFLEIVNRELAEVCVCVPGSVLLEAGAFGPGDPHSALEQRLGDYVLLARDGHAMIHTPTGLDPLYMPGSHGGMSRAEVQIPLYTVSP